MHAGVSSHMINVQVRKWLGRKRHTRSLRTAKRFEIVGNLLPSPHVLILHSEVHELENEATFLHACEIKFRGGLGMRG